jgi:hypothetical protein
MFDFLMGASALVGAFSKAIKAALIASAMCSALPDASREHHRQSGAPLRSLSSPDWYHTCISIGTRAAVRGVPPDLAIATAYYESGLRRGIVSRDGGLYGAMQVTGANIRRVGREDFDYEDVGIEVLRRYLALYPNVLDATCGYRFGSPRAAQCRAGYVSPRPGLAAAMSRSAGVKSDDRFGIFLTRDTWEIRSGRPREDMLARMVSAW